ncbi:TetR/AcrR family transcriptional regulator [Actinospica robiniae]|uniref:TetR/AcrR family transcriptional regulator n=1 Tax=Actinospica robiniae TaxID=304901 RepID=UPI0004165C88|nr:TetR/AcrR family transcriptional regulator [Actinospica robiniae]
MTTTTSEDPARRGGREAQRRRTRKAIVDAAIRLSAEGAAPSIDEIAAAADVSRRTVYLYFPTLDQLLLDAALGALNEPAVDKALADPAVDDAGDRIEVLVKTLFQQKPDSLPIGRRLIRLTVDPPAGGAQPAAAPRRSPRRIAWLEQACEPLRATLGEEAYHRLISALCAVVGWEAQIALRDVRGLDPQAELDTVIWAARALIAAAIKENAGRA